MQILPIGLLNEAGVAKAKVNRVARLVGRRVGNPATRKGGKMNIISIYLDGDQWCALLGEDLQVGITGFGPTPKQALENLIDQDDLINWNWEV